jgi:predicted permease
MDVAGILGSAASAVLQVLLLAGTGAFLERTGQMGPQRRAALSNVAFRVFLPSLLFINIVESASAEALRRQYSLPLFSFFFVLAGMVFGALLAPWATRAGDDFSPVLFLFSCSLNNVGYLPLIIVPATIAQGALHAPGTNIAVELKRGVSHIGLCILVLNVFTWVLAATVLKKKAQREGKGAGGEAAAAAAAAAAKLGAGGGNCAARLSRLPVPLPPFLVRLLGPVLDFLADILNPPVVGALSGLSIGLVPALRSLFFATPPLGLVDTAPLAPAIAQPPTLAVSLSAAASTLAAGIARCAGAGAGNEVLVRNATGWFLCAASRVAAAASCCVPLAASAEAYASPTTPALLAAAAGNVTETLLGTAGVTDSLAAMALLAGGVAGGGGGGGGGGGLPYVSPPSAPFGPTLTSALQAFAGAIIPTVAITLGSNILAKDEAAAKAREAKAKAKEAAEAAAAAAAAVVVATAPGDAEGGAAAAADIVVAEAAAPAAAASAASAASDNDATDLRVLGGTSGRGGPVSLAVFLDRARHALVRIGETLTGWDAETGTQVIRGRALFGVVLVRLLLMPLVGIGLVYAGVLAGIVPGADRTLVFVLLVEAATPTAMNLQLIADVMGSGSRAMARVIAVSYVLSVIGLTVWISVALALITGGLFERAV